jgi:hypothetical protein
MNKIFNKYIIILINLSKYNHKTNMIKLLNIKLLIIYRNIYLAHKNLRNNLLENKIIFIN